MKRSAGLQLHFGGLQLHFKRRCARARARCVRAPKFPNPKSTSTIRRWASCPTPRRGRQLREEEGRRLSHAHALQGCGPTARPSWEV